jgi:hypothetical protein
LQISGDVGKLVSSGSSYLPNKDTELLETPKAQSALLINIDRATKVEINL